MRSYVLRKVCELSCFRELWGLPACDVHARDQLPAGAGNLESAVYSDIIPFHPTI